MAVYPVYVSVWDSPLSTTNPKNNVDQVPVFLTSYLQDEKYWTASSSKFVLLGSIRQFFSSQILIEYLEVHPTIVPSEISHMTDASQQMEVSDTLPPLEGSSFSVITYTSIAQSTPILNRNTFSLENSLFICQSSPVGSSGPITKALPGQQTLCTFDGVSNTLLTSLGMAIYSTRQSSVQPSQFSASVSSKHSSLNKCVF